MPASKFKFLVLIAVSLFAATCRSDFNPPEVIASYPTQNADGIANDVTVSVEFSESMDNPQTETAFSLFSDGDRPKGQFIWSGNRLTFTPRGPLITGKNYTMLVGKAAEDSSGNNLRDDFQINFTVNPDAGKPAIVSTVPVYGQTGVLPTSVITIVFSEAVDPSTFIPGIVITPSITGAFSVNVTGETVTFTPQSNLLNGTVYTVSINTNIKDLAGNPLVLGRTVSFVVGTDFIRPTILSADTTPAFPITLTDGIVTAGVSRNDQIRLRFSELMNTTALTTAVVISPSNGFTKTFGVFGPGTEMILFFSPPLESQTLYTLTVNNSATDIANNILNQNYNYQFTTNATDSLRPIVLGVRQARTQLNSGVCTTTAGPCPTAPGALCPGPPGDVCNNQALSLAGLEYPAGAPAPLPAPPVPPGTVRLQNDTLDVTEQIDIDTSVGGTNFRIVLNVYFRNQMNLPSLIQATTFTPIIVGTGVINITDVQLDATLTRMSVYISGWNGAAGYYKLKIAGGVAKDLNNNFLLNDYILFTY